MASQVWLILTQRDRASLRLIMGTPRILAISNNPGAESARVRLLMSQVPSRVEFFDRQRHTPRGQVSREIWQLLRREAWDLVYLEGASAATGLPLILASRKWGQRYIVSAGDPVGGFFRTTRGPLWGWTMERFEYELYRRSAGFVGWTPYLTGKAIQMGAPRSVTVEGGVDLSRFRPLSPERRKADRARFGLDPDALVCGVVGSLTWTKRQQYCYGLELVETLRYLQRKDVFMLIVGDGEGRRILEERLPETLRDRVRFTGRLQDDDLVAAMNVMNIGFVTQTLDGLGSYRLTTKLPEYLACGLAVAMSPIPGYYDYASDVAWPLPASHPASEQFHRNCAAWLDSLTREDLAAKALCARRVAEQRFDYTMLGRRFAKFVLDLLK